MCLYFFSKNSRVVLSEREQWTYCKSMSVAKASVWAKLNVTLSRKPDHKLLPFFACCYAKHTGLSIPDALQYFLKQFTPDEKQNITIIRSHKHFLFSYCEVFRFQRNSCSVRHSVNKKIAGSNT